MRDTEEWHQPLGAESYESEVNGDEASEEDGEGAPQAEDAEQGELSVGSSPSSPEKTSRLGGHQFGENTLDSKKRKTSVQSPVWTVIKRLKDQSLKEDGSTHVCTKC